MEQMDDKTSDAQIRKPALRLRASKSLPRVVPTNIFHSTIRMPLVAKKLALAQGGFRIKRE